VVMVVPLAGLLLLGAYLAVRHLGQIWSRHWRILVVCLLWALPIAAFAVWYFPENVHFWTPLLVPLGAAVALVLEDAQVHFRQRRPLLLGLVAVALLFGANFVGSILPAHDPTSNWNRDAALLIGQHTQPEDLVVSLEAGEYKHLPPNVSCYGGNSTMGVRGSFFMEDGETFVARRITACVDEGHSVYLFGDVFESRQGHIGIARLAGLTEEQVRTRIEAMFDGCTLLPVAAVTLHPPLYRLTACRFETGAIPGGD